MDATAVGGGPGTFGFLIATGSPAEIGSYAHALRTKAERLTGLLGEFDLLAGDGVAATAVNSVAAESLRSLATIIDGIRDRARLLDTSAALVEAAQSAYRTVVAEVNPVVAMLLADRLSRPAAVALSTAATTVLREFVADVKRGLAAVNTNLPGKVDVAGLLADVRARVDQVRAVQQVVAELVVDGCSREGAVSVTVTGSWQFTSVRIDDRAVAERGAEHVGALVLEAVNDGIAKLTRASKAAFEPVIDAAVQPIQRTTEIL
jgi:DNA-binding protein YbaB